VGRGFAFCARRDKIKLFVAPKKRNVAAMRKKRPPEQKIEISQDEQCFLEAIRQGDAAAIQASLARAPGLAKTRTTAGAPALALAVTFGRVESVKALLADPGADADAQDGEGNTALMIAVGYGRDECARLLLQVSNTRAANKKGETALMFAVRRRAPQIVEELLGVSDANASNQEGRTALMLAAELGDAQSAAVLIPSSDASVAVSKATGEGGKLPKTAAWIAAQNGHLSVVKLFLGPKPAVDWDENPRLKAKRKAASEPSSEGGSPERSAEQKQSAKGALDASVRGRQRHWGIADFLSAEGYVSVEEAEEAFRAAPRGGMPRWERRFAEWEARQIQKEMRAAAGGAADSGVSQKRKPKAL